MTSEAPKSPVPSPPWESRAKTSWRPPFTQELRRPKPGEGNQQVSATTGSADCHLDLIGSRRMC